MAVSTSSIFSTAIQGIPQVGATADVFGGDDSSPQFPCGFLLETADGRRLRYGHFGAVTYPGDVVSPDKSESCANKSDLTVVDSASANTTTDGTIGYNHLEVTGTGTQDQFAGGYLVVTYGPGVGYEYTIKGNTATNTPATGNFRIELNENIQVAITSASRISIVGNKYANLEQADAFIDSLAVGVCADTISTAGYWGWIATRGIWAVHKEGPIETCSIAVISNVTDGCIRTLSPAAGISEASALFLQRLGLTMDGENSSGTHVPVNLTLE
jgi:hypothetical protein